MHSFQPSRGRVVFETLCALAIAASLAGAWMQTGASALLGAAAVALLYGVVHLFDMRQRSPAKAEPQRVEFEPIEVAPAPVAAIEPLPAVESASDDVELEPVGPRESSGRRKGGSRKGGGRRTKAAGDDKVIELVPPAQAEMVDEAAAMSFDDMPHPPVAPLFEPEPFVRTQRVMFGRKSR